MVALLHDFMGDIKSLTVPRKKRTLDDDRKSPEPDFLGNTQITH